MRNLDRPTAISLCKRVGLMLVAIGLGILLVLATLNSPSNFYSLGTSPFSQTFPAESFVSPQCCMGENYVTPTEIIALNISSVSGPLIVYFIQANQTDFSAWIAQDGAPNSGLLDQPQGMRYLNDYLGSHSEQILSNQTIPSNNTRLVKFQPADVELLTVIIANPGAATQFAQSNALPLNVRVPPDVVSTVVSLSFLVVGGVLAGMGFITKAQKSSEKH